MLFRTNNEFFNLSEPIKVQYRSNMLQTNSKNKTLPLKISVVMIKVKSVKFLILHLLLSGTHYFFSEKVECQEVLELNSDFKGGLINSGDPNQYHRPQKVSK